MTTFRALGLAAALAIAVLPASAKADDCAALSAAMEESQRSLERVSADLNYAIDTVSPDIDMWNDVWDLVHDRHMGDVNRWLAGGCLRIIIVYY